MIVDPSTTKYLIRASIKADGVIEKPDVVGAVFGQTEGLLGNELDLRDLQKSARIGRIEVEIDAKKGKSEGTILLPSSMDKVETAIMGAALESIDRVGPCKARILVEAVEDVRIVRRKQVITRAKEILSALVEDTKDDSADLTSEVRAAVQVAEITRFGPERLPAGPNVHNADAIIIVEGRNDVLNLLRHGIKNAVAVEGTSVPTSVADKSIECVTTAFVDGDRGGELILRELLLTCEVDFVARAPQTREVEELPHKLIMKALKNKVPAEQYAEQYGIKLKKDGQPAPKAVPKPDAKAPAPAKPAPAAAKKDDKPAPAAAKKEDKPAAPAAKKEEPKSKGGLFRRGKKDDGPPPTPIELSDEQVRFKAALEGLKGSLKAVLLDASGKEVQKGVAVRDLADTMKSAKGAVDAVVFDGVVTQRLLDIAAERSINHVVGAKVGNVTKQPDGVQIYSRDDLA